ACLLHSGAVKVTLPRGANADGHFWFRRPVRTRWDKHSGWWGISVTTVNGHRYYTAAYQVGGMSLRERHTIKRCADRILRVPPSRPIPAWRTNALYTAE